jgi:hypothetical protein
LTRILAAILTGLYSGSYCAVHAVRFAWEAYNAGAEHYQYTRACEILVKAGKLSPTCSELRTSGRLLDNRTPFQLEFTENIAGVPLTLSQNVLALSENSSKTSPCAQIP